MENESFRPLRRTKRAISEEDAKTLLKSEKRGVLAVNGENGYPFAFPIDYFYDETENKIYFHGAKTGLKADSLKKSDKICFTVYGNDRYEKDWAPYVQSVVVYGRCSMPEDDAMKEDKIRTLALKYYPNAEEVEAEIARDITAAQLYEITIEHMTGKRIHER